MQKLILWSLQGIWKFYYRETKGRNNSKELKRLGKRAGYVLRTENYVFTMRMNLI